MQSLEIVLMHFLACSLPQSYEEFTFTNERGDTLQAAQHLPKGPAQAILVWHHGYGEHMGRYREGSCLNMLYMCFHCYTVGGLMHGIPNARHAICGSRSSIVTCRRSVATQNIWPNDK